MSRDLTPRYVTAGTIRVGQRIEPEHYGPGEVTEVDRSTVTGAGEQLTRFRFRPDDPSKLPQGNSTGQVGFWNCRRTHRFKLV